MSRITEVPMSRCTIITSHVKVGLHLHLGICVQLVSDPLAQRVPLPDSPSSHLLNMRPCLIGSDHRSSILLSPFSDEIRSHMSVFGLLRLSTRHLDNMLNQLETFDPVPNKHTVAAADVFYELSWLLLMTV